MAATPNIVPVYSYTRFKELAEDRMNQVRIFVQTGDRWLPCGTGLLQFCQVGPNTTLRELASPGQYNPELRSLYLMVEVAAGQVLPELEMQLLRTHFDVLNSRAFRLQHSIMFYDLKNGSGFEPDIDRNLTRQSHQLEPQAPLGHSSSHQLYI